MHRSRGLRILEKIVFDLHQLYKVDYDLQITFFKIFDSARAEKQLFSISPNGFYYLAIQMAETTPIF